MNVVGSGGGMAEALSPEGPEPMTEIKLMLVSNRKVELTMGLFNPLLAPSALPPLPPFSRDANPDGASGPHGLGLGPRPLRGPGHLDDLSRGPRCLTKV